MSKLVQNLKLSALFITAFGYASVTFAAVDNVSAQQWLMRMAEASANTNYEGVITYQYGNRLVAAKVYQRVIDGKQERRLVYLDGKQDEVIHSGNVMKFVSARSSQQKDIEQNEQVDVNIKSLPGRLSGVSAAYDLLIVGSQRIADRNAVVIKMQPKDPFRYAHILFVDKATSLLLKSETMSDSAMPLERFQFVELNINDSPLLQQYVSQYVTPFNFNKLKKTFASAVNFTSSRNQVQPLGWVVSWMPKGYSLVSSEHEKKNFSSCMFTDGMSSFSVYVEPKSKNYSEGVMRQGASIVVLKRIQLANEEKVAIVAGDIPISTAERIIQSIRVEP